MNADVRTTELTRMSPIAMTDEQLNIAICERRGWTTTAPMLAPMSKYWVSPDGTTDKIPPNHITGIEALGNMHEAEKELSEEQHKQFRIMMVRDSSCWTREVVSSSARHRAESLFMAVTGRCNG